jgi:adenylate cyclase
VRLNRFYDLASQPVFRYDGTLDKLVGDQVMAFFGAPVDSNSKVKATGHRLAVRQAVRA